MDDRIQVLFLCRGNSCRSQMAEGLCRHLHGDCIAPFSAGTENHGLDPLALRVMSEIGVDIAAHHSKTADSLQGHVFDYVVTVCGHAHETCPRFPGKATVIHQSFADPPALAAAAADETEALAHYRRVRDEIRDYILTLPDVLGAAQPVARRDASEPGRPNERTRP